MRKIRYAVAMSLDGHIAGPNEEYDWIGTDPEVDFGAMWSQFDALLMGRRTYKLAVQTRGKSGFHGFHWSSFHCLLADSQTARAPPRSRRAGVECRLGKRLESSKRKGHLVVWW